MGGTMMKRKAKTSDNLETNEEDVVYLPESTLREIDTAIKNTKLYSNREEFIEAAIQNFISIANKQKSK